MTDDPFTFSGQTLDNGNSMPENLAPVKKDRRPEVLIDPYGNSGLKAKKTDLNPKQRDWFEKNGWTFYRVEKPNYYGAVTVDMWGFADYIACHPKHGIWLFQITTRSNSASHVKKIKAAPEFLLWLAAGGRVCLSLWDQPNGPRTTWRIENREMVAA